MKKYFVWILPLLMVSALFLSSCSEDDKTTAFNKIKDKLALSEEKAAMVRPIFMEQADKISAILEEAKNNRPASNEGYVPLPSQGGNTPALNITSDPTMAKLASVNNDADEKLANILTAPQITEYDRVIRRYTTKILEEDHPSASPKGGKHGKGGMGGMGGMRPGGF